MGEPDHTCEYCRYWKPGDTSGKGIGNVGICSALQPQTSEFYGKNKRSPFWAQHLAFQTTSWEGTDCATFKGAKA